MRGHRPGYRFAHPGYEIVPTPPVTEARYSAGSCAITASSSRSATRNMRASSARL